jgi:hypothetical protein
MSNFLSLYHDYVKETEPPPNFHAWSAIGALSALLGKKCFIPQGDFTVHPETYIILVGDPGIKKSTAMGIAKSLVKSVETVKLASDCGSREGLMDEMSRNKVECKIPYWQSAIFVDEVGDLLGGDHLDQSMVRFLTTIWGQTLYREVTRKGGQVTIHNPYLTLLGCCPTKWINTKLSQDVVTDGLTRRTIFVLETKRNKLNPWPIRTSERERVLGLLRQEAARIHQIEGIFTLSQEAFNFYCSTYYKIQQTIDEQEPKTQSYFSSKHVLILKLCMCLSAAVDSTKMVSKQMVEFSCIFLEQSERNFPDIFASVGRNVLKGYSEKILNKIKAAGKGGLTRSSITKQFYEDLSAAELDEVLKMILDTHQATLTPVGTAQGEPVYRAVATDPLPPAVDLLELTRLLEPCEEGPMTNERTTLQIHPLDPVTVQLLTRQEHYRQQTGSGILLKGTPALVVDESSTPSGLALL